MSQPPKSGQSDEKMSLSTVDTDTSITQEKQEEREKVA